MPDKPPWPKGHKGHWWSGWPGATCLRCGAEDPLEIGLADNTYDPITGTWDTEEHRLEFERACICPADAENTDG